MDIAKSNKKRGYLYCKWEYYFVKDEFYYPFKRTDTSIYVQPYKIKWDEGPNHYMLDIKSFTRLLQGLLEIEDFEKHAARIDKLPQKKLEDVQRYNASFYNIPVIKDSELATGVFLSFEEFKHNKPSVKIFREDNQKIRRQGRENYIEDEKGVPITQYWGYNNNNGLKIGKFGNEKIFRVGNTFEFFALYQLFRGNASLFPTSLYRDYNYWMPYQLDMETGEIYQSFAIL
ncbi:MAG: hypothetical protein U0V75_12810 [Ferruginibacter sp.]